MGTEEWTRTLNLRITSAGSILRLDAENETLRAGYDAARMEIESPKRYDQTVLELCEAITKGKQHD